MKFNNYDEHIFKSIKTFYIQKNLNLYLYYS